MRQSKASFRQAQRVSGYNLSTRRECVFAFFDTLHHLFLNPLNSRLAAHRNRGPGGPVLDMHVYGEVAKEEFMVWLGVFISMMAGTPPAAVFHHLVPFMGGMALERFRAIKLCLHISAHRDTPLSQKKVRACLWRRFCVCVAHLVVWQDWSKAVQEFENAVFHRARRLLLVDGMVASLRNWQWQYRGCDLPVSQTLSTGHQGWVAGAIVSAPDYYVLGTRKRGIVVGSTGQEMVETVRVGLHC